MSDPVEGMTEGVKTIAINARKPEGDTIDSKEQIREILKQCKEDGSVPIIHFVYGSKTGICEQFDDEIIQETKDLGGLIVVDACQGRFQSSFLTDTISREALMLFTGSKFFRGPPFSGAIFIPASIMNKMRGDHGDASIP